MYGEAATGKSTFYGTVDKARDEVWSVVRELITSADDAVNVPNLGDGSISDRVDIVMSSVANGSLTIQQGKRLIEMLQAGFEITELKDLIAKLSYAGVELE